MSCVFINLAQVNENGYYEFTLEITSKEQIRDFLNTDNQPVIDQFEHWYDKYYMSLNKPNKQVEDSEKVMYRHLKELGYE